MVDRQPGVEEDVVNEKMEKLNMSAGPQSPGKKIENYRYWITAFYCIRKYRYPLFPCEYIIYIAICSH